MRFEGTGALTAEICRRIGLVGVAARACGRDIDVRRDYPYGMYRYAQIPVSICDTGDVFARAHVRALEIQQKICAPCYRDWINMSVKLVNEMRMDTTDPRGQELWLKQMKLFLNLDGASTDPWSRHLDKPVVIETTGGVRARATLLGATADALTLADFEGGAIPAGFEASSGVRGSATIARDAVKTLEPAA
jgi:hypothetical protein